MDPPESSQRTETTSHSESKSNSTHTVPSETTAHSESSPPADEKGPSQEEIDEHYALSSRPHASIRIHPIARPWHCFQDIKDLNALLQAPDFQAAFPGGQCVPCATDDLSSWIYYDSNLKAGPENEYMLLAAADPAYQKVLDKMVEDEECTGSTKWFVPSHRFEPAENAQEIRDSLPRNASVEEAVGALLRTCKGCAELYNTDSKCA